MKTKHDCVKPTHHPCRHCGGKTTKPVKKFMHRKIVHDKTCGTCDAFELDLLTGNDQTGACEIGKFIVQSGDKCQLNNKPEVE